MLEDRTQIDLLIIIGTSLKVSPVSDIIGTCRSPSHVHAAHSSASGTRRTVQHTYPIRYHKYVVYLPHRSDPRAHIRSHSCNFAQILINKTPIRHINPDVRT